jgi:hypothetical protein
MHHLILSDQSSPSIARFAGDQYPVGKQATVDNHPASPAITPKNHPTIAQNTMKFRNHSRLFSVNLARSRQHSVGCHKDINAWL